MSDLGKLTYYLGIEVTQRADDIRIKQGGYAQGILVKTKMESGNYTHVPMHTSLKISKAEEEPKIDATSCRSTIRCLRYLLHTRPNLAFSVVVLSRYMQIPSESHEQAVKHMLRYIKDTTEYDLFFKRNGTTEITGYSNSSRNIDVDDGRSTTWFMFYLGTSPITWTSCKQPTVALSSCEAESWHIQKQLGIKIVSSNENFLLYLHWGYCIEHFFLFSSKLFSLLYNKTKE